MTERETWASDLRQAADELEALSAADLASDKVMHDRFCRLIHRFKVLEVIYADIKDEVQYPPDWDNLAGAVDNVSGPVLLGNMWGWVSQNRWMDSPLSIVHEKGRLAPALRKLADYIATVTLKPGWGY